LAWKVEARVPAARVRLNAIVAQTCQVPGLMEACNSR